MRRKIKFSIILPVRHSHINSECVGHFLYFVEIDFELFRVFLPGFGLVFERVLGGGNFDGITHKSTGPIGAQPPEFSGVVGQQ